MRALSHKILVLIVNANSERDKRQSLVEAREKLEEIKILARISMELKVFANINSFECLVKMIVETARQNEGWMRSLNPRPEGYHERTFLRVVFPAALEKKYVALAVSKGYSVYIVDEKKDIKFNHKLLTRVLTKLIYA